MRRTLFFLSILLYTASGRAQQPSASGPDEAAIIEQLRTTMRFADDGTGTREAFLRVKAQSEAGVQQWGQVVVGYNAATERIEIPLVRVHKADGSSVDTPSSAIQDLTSPVERIAPVYTDYHQKHVTVQSFRPGDTLEVRILTTIHTPLAAHQFWTDYNFTDDGIVLDEQLDIDVPAARHVTLKTRPGFDPTIKENAGRRTYHWTHAHLVREKKDDDTKDKKKMAPDQPPLAAVRLTTFTDWAEVGHWFAGLERSARVVTPDVKAKAAQLVTGRTTELEKVEALYDYVSKDFRYVSLSLGLGRYQPRAAADVMHDAYGDCKDKHTLLAALVDAAGFQASAALINSGVKIDPDFPSPGQFDHVITRVVAGGQVIWLDATPEVAPFRLLSSNLRAKQALLTDVDPAPRLEETPADPPMPALVESAVDGALDTAGTLTAKVGLTFRGDLELGLRAAFRMVPAARWPDVVEQIVREAGIDAKVSAVTVSDPLATREPFTIGLQIEATAFADFEKKKIDLELPLAGRTAPIELPDTDPMTVGGPSLVGYRMKLQLPPDVKVRLPLPVTIARDYGEYRSQYAAAGSVITASRALTLKPRELPDTRRADVSSFLHAVQNDTDQKLGIDATAMTVAAVAPAAEAKKLNQAGYAALTARDYAKARDLLRRVVELDPKDKTAWNNLGEAYRGLRQVDEAIAAYRRQLEVNPYDEYAYNYIGFAYASEDKTAEAEAAYLKQLELNPLDRYAHGALGRLYISAHAYDKAAAALEKAVTISPDSASLQVQLGKAQINLKNADQARAAFARAVELSPGPGTWNSVAYELALAGIDLDRAQQYAESAVSSVAAASRNLDVDRADAAAFGVVNSLGAYWDTLGWVYFAKGDMANAQRFVAPAWKLAEQAEVGDHLGQIHEKLGQRDKAAAAYGAALSSRQPAPEVRDHLTRVVPAAKVDSTIAAHRGDTSATHTFALAGQGPAGGKADFLVLFSAPDAVESVKFIEGDASMQALTPAIRRIPAAGMFPDASPSRILRRAMAGCNDRGACTITLVLPEDARPVK